MLAAIFFERQSQRGQMLILKRIIQIATGTILAFALVACAMHLSNSGTQVSRANSDESLRVATYNVHYIIMGRETGSWSVGDWDRRKAPLSAAVTETDADVIAFQEMESFAGRDQGGFNLTLDYLLENNPQYAAGAVGNWQEFPSTQPIFYRKDKLRLLDEGWFFFSDTPDVIYSRTFNGSFPAFCSWVKLATNSGEEFYVYNVHFEYRSASNRRLSAELVKERVMPVIEAGGSAFMVGDLNTRRGGESLEILEGASFAFVPVEGSTYHFNRGINLFGAIDHIGATPDIQPVGAPVVIRRKFLDEWPTDHYPVFADFDLLSSGQN